MTKPSSLALRIAASRTAVAATLVAGVLSAFASCCCGYDGIPLGPSCSDHAEGEACGSVAFVEQARADCSEASQCGPCIGTRDFVPREPVRRHEASMTALPSPSPVGSVCDGVTAAPSPFGRAPAAFLRTRSALQMLQTVVLLS